MLSSRVPSFANCHDNLLSLYRNALVFDRPQILHSYRYREQTLLAIPSAAAIVGYIL